MNAHTNPQVRPSDYCFVERKLPRIDVENPRGPGVSIDNVGLQYDL